MPVDAHPLHHRIREVRIQTHARRECNRITRERAHQQTPHRGRKTSRCRNARNRHPGVMQNRRIHEDDVSHRHERRHARQNFSPPGCAQCREFEVAFRARYEWPHERYFSIARTALPRWLTPNFFSPSTSPNEQPNGG